MKFKLLFSISLLAIGVVVACKQPIDNRYYRKTRGVEFSGGRQENNTTGRQQKRQGGHTTQSSSSVEEISSSALETTSASHQAYETQAPQEDTDGPYNKSPIVGAPEIEQEVCPYGAIPGTCDCPDGLVEVDGICTGVTCRGSGEGRNYDCYFGENQCGKDCDKDGRNCWYGACFADEAKCDQITPGNWVFNPNLRTNRGGCENKKEGISCVRGVNGYTCYHDGQYCGDKCASNGTACQRGMCIPQSCNNIDGRKWTFSHIGYGDYGYGCMNPEGNLKCTKDDSTYRCFWPRKGNDWKDVLYTYPCSKGGKCKNR